jgi:hypothetical protein
MTKKKSKNLNISRKKKSPARGDEGKNPNSNNQFLNKLQDTITKSQNPSQSPRISSTGQACRKERDRGKSSFHAKVLEEAEVLDFETVAGTEGLDDEITLLRVKIKSLMKRDPENIKLLMAAANMLTKLVKARYSMNKKQEKNLGEAIKNIIKDIGVPLGVAVLNKKL